MNDSDAPQPKIPNPLQWSRNMAEIAQLSEKLVREFLGKQQAGGLGMADPLNIGNAFLEMTQRMMRDPGRLVQAQLSLWQDYLRLWQSTTHRLLGGAPEPVAEPAPGDRRFKDAAWQESTLFDYIKQSYLLTARWLQSTVQQVDGLDEKTARKVDFYTRQFVDAIAPSNFVLTNPEVLRATIDSRGENLVNGLKHVLEDLDRGKGRLMIKMTDLDAFKVGVNIAVTKGKVVFQNALMQLIQYEPLTEKAQRRPLLIIPPWINKYYILDLRPDNSFIKWAVQQGHTVFVISWVNPDETLAQKQFEDYMLEGPLAALDAIRDATGEKEANVIGYCLGGTLLAATLAYMAAKKDNRVKSATYFVTMVDFAEAGELSVFIDEEQLAALEGRMREHGYLEGSDMATTFNMLRANDLIWSFVVNNYLLGKEPFPFDLLYWNSDSTRMPAAMHAYLPAQHVRAEQADRAGRAHARRGPDRSAQDRDASLPAFDQGGSHRAVEIDLCRDADLSRAEEIRARRLRPYRGRRQSARPLEIRPLGGRHAAQNRRRMAGGSPLCPGFVVARLGKMGRGICRRRGRGAPARRRQAQTFGRRARLLCAGVSRLSLGPDCTAYVRLTH